MSAYPEIFNHISRKKSSFLKLLQPDLFQVLKEQLQEQVQEPSTVATGFGRHDAPPASNPDLWPFDLETGIRVASRGGDLPSKIGHARPLGSRIIRYVRDGRTEEQTDGWTDGQKQHLLPPSYGREHNKSAYPACMSSWNTMQNDGCIIHFHLFVYFQLTPKHSLHHTENCIEKLTTKSDIFCSTLSTLSVLQHVFHVSQK